MVWRLNLVDDLSGREGGAGASNGASSGARAGGGCRSRVLVVAVGGFGAGMRRHEVSRLLRASRALRARR